MTKYVVWETEYPEEGSTLYDAESAEQAMQFYESDTGVLREQTELSASVATPEILAARGEE